MCETNEKTSKCGNHFELDIFYKGPVKMNMKIFCFEAFKYQKHEYLNPLKSWNILRKSPVYLNLNSDFCCGR